MILTRTPLRITFVGGGTDIKEFFKYEYGAVINAAIDKYVYLSVNHNFYPQIRCKYSKIEEVMRVDEIQHPLFREALKHVGIESHVEIAALADFPSKGSGMGSSSAFLVGLLNALYAYKGEIKSPEFLAKTAYHIEREVLNEAGGMQDQYISAYGGFRFMEFHDEGNVNVSHMLCRPETEQAIQERMMLFFTGFTRDEEVQSHTLKSIESNLQRLFSIKKQVLDLRESLRRGEHEKVGIHMHEYWKQKRQLSSKISTNKIDTCYQKAIDAGAIGGKLLGAGGGGFLLFYVPPSRQSAVRNALNDLEQVPFKFVYDGSKIVYSNESNWRKSKP